MLHESKLPGLSEWKRVFDHRTYMLSQMPNVQTYVESLLSADDILVYGFEHVAMATGATWRIDGVGRTNRHANSIEPDANVISPDDILRGAELTKRVVVFDAEHYYLASAIAEKLQIAGAQVI